MRIRIPADTFLPSEGESMARLKSIIKNTAVVLAAFVVLFAAIFSFASAKPTPAYAASKKISITTTVKEVDAYGNLVLKISKKKLYAAGFARNDLVKVSIEGRDYKYIMPIHKGTLIFGKNYIDINNGKVKVARTRRSFAGREKLKRSVGKKVKITLYKAKGFKIPAPPLTIEERNTDEYEFTNFRIVTGGNLGKGALFRSHCPVTETDRYPNRLGLINDLMEKHQINTVISMNINAAEMDKYLDPEKSPTYAKLFQEGKVNAIKVPGAKINTKEYKNDIKEELIFMAENEGPYLVHCAIGRDRTGFMISLLEALMGVSYEEIAEDYVLSYRNYNGVKPGTKLDKYLKTSIDDHIQTWTKGSRYKLPSKVNLKKAAENYIKNTIGLTQAQIDSLRANLSKDYE